MPADQTKGGIRDFHAFAFQLEDPADADGNTESAKIAATFIDRNHNKNLAKNLIFKSKDFSGLRSKHLHKPHPLPERHFAKTHPAFE
jgi:hypothetical protein